MNEWRVVNERRRRWHLLSWHGTYWVYEKSPGRWMIQFCDLFLAGAYTFAAAIAFAEWHEDLHGGRFDA